MPMLDDLRQEGWPDAADEIERLRAALRAILGLAVNPEFGGGLINAKRIAREALKVKE